MEDLLNSQKKWQLKYPNDTPPAFLRLRPGGYNTRKKENSLSSLHSREEDPLTIDDALALLDQTETKIKTLQKTLEQELFVRDCLEKLIVTLRAGESENITRGFRRQSKPDLLLNAVQDVIPINNVLSENQQNVIKVKSSDFKPRAKTSFFTDARRSLSCLNTSLGDLDIAQVWSQSGGDNSSPLNNQLVDTNRNTSSELPITATQTLSDSVPLFAESSMSNQRSGSPNLSVNMSKVNEPQVDRDNMNMKAKVCTQPAIAKKPFRPVPLPRKRLAKDTCNTGAVQPVTNVHTNKHLSGGSSSTSHLLHTTSSATLHTETQTSGRGLCVSSSGTVTLDNNRLSSGESDCILEHKPITTIHNKAGQESGVSEGDYDNVVLVATNKKDYPINCTQGGQYADGQHQEKGVKDLCAQSLFHSYQISKSLADNTKNTPDSEEMKKFYSSRRERVVEGSVDVGECQNLTGTYRKIKDSDNFRGSSDSIDSVNSGNAVEVRSKNIRNSSGSDSSSRPSSKRHSNQRLSNGSNKSNSGVLDVSQSTNVQATNPPLEKPKRKKDKQPNYENWTINAVVTQGSDSASDDEYLYENMEFFGRSAFIQNSHKGSKDSGLCDDLSNSETAITDNTSTSSFSDDVFRNMKETEMLKNKCDSHNTNRNDDDDDDDDDEEDDGGLNIKSDTSGDSGDSENNKDNDCSDYQPSAADENRSLQTRDVDNDPPPRKLSPAMERVVLGGSPNYSSGEEEVNSNDSFDECDSRPLTEREKQLTLRQHVLEGVLEGELAYVEILNVIVKYKMSLKGSASTSMPVISNKDIDAIFSNIEQLYSVHGEFVHSLAERIKHPLESQLVGDIFKLLIFQFPEFKTYMANYQHAVATIHKCCQESQRFQELAQEITLPAKEKITLEAVLFKPVNRYQRNSLVLHDIKRFTPEDHPDFLPLKKASELSIYNLQETPGAPDEKSEDRRNLVKTSFIVELEKDTRKLRCLFLFSDLLICAKRESHRGKVSFTVKWFMRLTSLSCDTRIEYQDDCKISNEENIADLKQKIWKMKSDLREEMKKESDSNKHFSISGMAAARHVEKLKKKIQESEGQMILSCPKLPFKLVAEHGEAQSRVLLMTTDYEREEWRETIASLSKKSTGCKTQDFTHVQAQERIDSVKELPQVNRIGTVIMQKDEDVLDGTLNVTIHKLIGLTSPADTYCCLEMDSFGHFFMKAKTDVSSNTADPSWNQDFELELDGSQTLRILCYQKGVEKGGDTLLGRGAFELGKEWLKSYFQEKTVSMNEVSLVISVKHTAAEKTMRRTPSKHKLALFGVKISTCTRRESKTVPTIVQACIAQVQKRGLDEIGIYRVSGVTSEVQKLKKVFDKSIKAGVNCVADADIHAVTGVLKLYFRELPEPLFTESQYTVFKESMRLSDQEAKEKVMLKLLHHLPEANYYTIVYLIEHLIDVAKNEHVNKMGLHNLSTIFGPTLMAPAVKENSMNPIEMMNKGAEEVMHQSQIVGYYLQLAASGRNLRRSVPC